MYPPAMRTIDKEPPGKNKMRQTKPNHKKRLYPLGGWQVIAFIRRGCDLTPRTLVNSKNTLTEV